MTQQIISANLKKNENDHNVLTFDFGSNNVKVLDLDQENDGNQIKELFATMLEKMMNGPIVIKPSIPEERENDLYGAVSKAYIDQLNVEIQRVQTKVDSFLDKYNLGKDETIS